MMDAAVLPGPVVSGRRNPLHFGLADRLTKAREAANVTRAKLSMSAGLSDDAALYIERGTRVPGIDTTERIARALGVSACHLAYGLEGGAVLPADAPLACEGAGARLASVRTAQGLSLRAVARAAQMTPSGVSSIETGRTMPSVATVEDLAKALDVSPCWLAYGEGAMELPPRRKPAPKTPPAARRVRAPRRSA